VPRVLVIGSANVDYVVTAERLPRPGETVSDGTLLVTHGGKGANQAVAARRLGAEVRFIGCVGCDAAGADVRAGLEREGVGLAGLVEDEAAATGTALIVVDSVGRNQIAVAPGANRRLQIPHVEARAADFAWAEVVVCQLETPPAVVARALALGRERGAVTILNPAPMRELAPDIWPLVDYLTPNESEAGRLRGRPVHDPRAARDVAQGLLARGVGTVIVTRGEQGVVALGRAGALDLPAIAVTAVDTTAAGDAFNGALAVALGERREFANALRFAVGAAALACTRRGARPSLPGRAEVEALLGAPTT
jgi:ribokinase